MAASQGNSKRHAEHSLLLLLPNLSRAVTAQRLTMQPLLFVRDMNTSYARSPRPHQPV